jgi:hypothetical protein
MGSAVRSGCDNLRVNSPNGAAVTLILAVAVVVAAGSLPLLWQLHINRRWSKASATVVRMDRKMGEEGPIRVPTIEFCVEGRTHIVKASYGQMYGAKSKYSVGQTVDILYHPENPASAVLESSPGVVLFFSCVLAFIALGFVLNLRP